jgi:hypothetical protein
MARVIVYGTATIQRYATVDVPNDVTDVAAEACARATRLTIPTPSHAPYLDSEDGWRINDAHFDEVTITETLVQ